MPKLKNLKELHALQGCYCLFSHLIKKDAHFEWDESYCMAFEKNNKYFSNPPVLGAPIPEKPLVLYITAKKKSLGASCIQMHEKERKLLYTTKFIHWLVLN